SDGRDRTAARQRAALPSRHEPVSRGVRAGRRAAARCRARWRRNDVSRVPAGARPPARTREVNAVARFAQGLVAAAFAALVCASAAAQDAIEVLPVQGQVFLLAGPGGNTAVQVGDEAVVVVDTQTAAVSGQMLAAIERL